MPLEDTIILEFSKYQLYDKAPFIIQEDLECKVEKINECKSNLRNSSTAKVSQHIALWFSMSATSLFRSQKTSMMDTVIKVV